MSALCAQVQSLATFQHMTPEFAAARRRDEIAARWGRVHWFEARWMLECLTVEGMSIEEVRAKFGRSAHAIQTQVRRLTGMAPGQAHKHYVDHGWTWKDPGFTHRWVGGPRRPDASPQAIRRRLPAGVPWAY